MRVEKKPSTARRLISYATMGALVFVFLLILLVALLLVYPYEGFSIEAINADETGGALIVTDTGEVTKDGTPVVNDTFSYAVDSCNPEAFDITAVRWFDRLGSFSAASADQTTLQVDELATSIQASEIIFRVDEDDLPEDGCASGEVNVKLWEDVNPGAFYRLRTVYTYQPNPIRTDEAVMSTQVFYVPYPDEEF